MHGCTQWNNFKFCKLCFIPIFW